MPMLTPSQYMARYQNLIVPRKDGGRDTVKVTAYRLNGTTTVNQKLLDTMLRLLQSRGIDTGLYVHTPKGALAIDLDINPISEVLQIDPALNSENHFHRRKDLYTYREENAAGQTTRTSTNIANWHWLIWYCFMGKGSPEHCQIVLQLAAHWGVPPSGMQAFADAALGLDCNGFVGNYLWRVFYGKPWNTIRLGHFDLGPSMSIAGYFDKFARGNKYLASPDQYDASASYILGRTNPAGVVIGVKDNGVIGHVGITEPGGFERTGSKPENFRIRVIEATASSSPSGLSDSWYECQAIDPKTRVFTFLRTAMSHNRVLNFKLAKVA